MKFTLILSFTLVLVLFSCKKEKPLPQQSVIPCENILHANYSYDTVYPSEYLMTYPGLWWQFSDGSIDSCFSWEEVSIAVTTPNGDCQVTEEDRKFLPFSSYGYISFESKVYSFSNYQTTKFVHSVKDTVGVIYSEHSSVSGSPGVPNGSVSTHIVTSYGKVNAMNIGSVTYNDVIHVKDSSRLYYPFLGSGPFTTRDYFYAKDIGIVRKIERTPSGLDTFDLVDYYIAPH